MTTPLCSPSRVGVFLTSPVSVDSNVLDAQVILEMLSFESRMNEALARPGISLSRSSSQNKGLDMQVTPVGGTEPRAMPMTSVVVPATGAPATTTSAPATGLPIYKDSLSCTFQAISGAAATVIIEGSNDGGVSWVPAIGGVLANSTITLAGAGTGVVMDAFPTPFRLVRARTTAATTPTNVWMGV